MIRTSKKSSRECAQGSEQSEDGKRNELLCRIKHGSKTTVSTRPWFLEAAGFNYTGLVLNTRKDPSGPEKRSPDIYERSSPREFFTVNLEYFLLDENYQCKRPFINEVYARHFEHRPFPTDSCEANNIVFNNGAIGADFNKAGIALDPERIYDLHYLFAERA